MNLQKIQNEILKLKMKQAELLKEADSLKYQIRMAYIGLHDCEDKEKVTPPVMSKAAKDRCDFLHPCRECREKQNSYEGGADSFSLKRIK